MPFDINAVIAAHAGQDHSLYEAHVNPRFARALRIIGFDRTYVRGQGAYLWDETGRKYLDMLAGYGVFSIGRNHPVVKQALADVMAADMSSLVQMETPLLCGVMARELKARAGYDLDKVYFCSTGAEGVETAIKFARRATGRPRIVYASSAFHGLTTGALSLNGSDVFREKFGPLGDSAQGAFRRCGRAAAGTGQGRRGGVLRGTGAGQGGAYSAGRVSRRGDAGLPAGRRAAGRRRGAGGHGAHGEVPGAAP
jgi:4-aminobutyrate aminotransferase-like enzyme